jgi:D-amino-acid oxidase
MPVVLPGDHASSAGYVAGVRVLVIGSGVVGLTAAFVLRERGHDVAVWSRDDPADTVSAVAGAIWYPFLAEPRARVLGWARATFRRLQALARDPASGVDMQPVVEVFATPAPDLWWADAAGPIVRLPAAAVAPPHRAAIATEVPVCDVSVHLPWLVALLRSRGVGIERRHVRSFDEAFAAADAVVNCTGLGARDLCGDQTLVPVRGQVVVVAGRIAGPARIDDSGERPLYVIPRRDDTVLGGTAQHGDWSRAVDDDDSRAIVAAASAAVPEVAGRAVRAVRVGLRPFRPTVRLERERQRNGRILVHDYGHGGSGYTLGFGCAEEVADLLAD